MFSSLLTSIQEAESVQSFFIAVGPLLLVSMTISSMLFFFWYFGFTLSEQRRKARWWLVDNIGLVQQYKDLDELLDGLGQKTSVCKKCNNDKMQLWNYQQEGLLVVRCRSCKMNYTFTKEHNELVQLILSQMENATKLVNILVRYRYQALGKLLARNLSIDASAMRSEINPLEVLHFTARKERLRTEPVNDIHVEFYVV
ncbi:hypothetical protein [Zobellia alginiliquefaciens]|uniref:hypothetical protein n=1 Tax=Zobellia alginiliquefaciens TaxID=3032586 RepID=UPI0023E479D8|nr:hypothetical protein [Zobellia alginiliquefaciens]